MGGLQIVVTGAEAGDDCALSELRGELLDQSALMGVLSTLFDLRLPLVGVECRPAMAAGTRATPADTLRSVPASPHEAASTQG
jgi:hypothetical protein